MGEQRFVVSDIFHDQCCGEAATGAMALDDRYVCIGTVEGYAIFEYPELELLAKERVFVPELESFTSVSGFRSATDFDVCCTAVQMYNGKIVIFNPYDKFGVPYEWRLFVISAGSNEIERVIRLPDGYWRFVGGVEGREVVIYDRRRQTGLLKFDVEQEETVWFSDGFAQLSRVQYDDRSKLLLAISGAELILEVDWRDGSSRTMVGLPEPGSIKWTAVLRLSDVLYCAGGFDRESRNYVLGLFDQRSGTAKLVRKPYLEFFRDSGQYCDVILDRYAGNGESSSFLENSTFQDAFFDLAQEDTDIDNVAALFERKEGVIWALLGGENTGEEGISTVSGCTLIEVRLDDFDRWESITLSNWYGCSSVIQLPNRELLVQCGGGVLRVR